MLSKLRIHYETLIFEASKFDLYRQTSKNKYLLSKTFRVNLTLSEILKIKKIESLFFKTGLI